jgi:small-conductance mechanosensitive channel
VATRTNHPTTPVPGGELARLLDAEGRLEEALASARADAEARLATATAETERQVAALDAEIAAAATALRGRIDAERAAREAEITATGEREAERFARVTDARIDTLARDLAVLLIEGMEQRP